MVEIELHGERAVVHEDGVWKCRDPGIANLLNCLPYRRTEAQQDALSYDPDPAATAAQEAVNYYGARIVRQSAERPEMPGRVY